MALARALRPLRRELDNTRKNPPEARTTFESARDRNDYLADLESYRDRLSLQKDSFKDVQRQYLQFNWTTPTDQKAADDQADADSELLVAVDKLFAELNATIRLLSQKRSDDRENAKAKADRDALKEKLNAPEPMPAKLPKLTLPTFGGNILEWKTFWDRFRVSVHESNIAAVYKLTYLVGLLKGDALQLVSSLPVEDANYNVAIKRLADKYGDSSTVIEKLYVGLTEIQPAQNQRALREVVDKIELTLDALQAQGEDVNHKTFAAIIKSKLPPAVLEKLECEHEDDEEDWDVDKLRERLRLHLKIHEKAYQKANDKATPSEKSETFNSPDNSSKSVAPKQGRNPFRSTTGALFSQTPGNGKYSQQKPHYNHTSSSGQNSPSTNLDQPQSTKICPFCSKKGHYAEACRTVPSLADRKQQLKAKRLCFNCLKSNHSIAQCPRTKPCFTCRQVKRHHSSICPVKFSNSNSEPAALAPDNASKSATQSESSLLAQNEYSLLQTVLATFSSIDGSISKTTRGVFDNGCQRSYITEELANQLKLKILSKHKLSVFTFGASPPKEIETKVTEVQIQLRDGNFFKFFANVVPVITGNVQRVALDQKKFSNLFHDLPLADSLPKQPESVAIQFLIGSDYMWDLITMEKIPLTEGLYLLSSKLGWLVAGRIKNQEAVTQSQTSLFTTNLISSQIYTNAFVLNSDSQFEKIDTPLVRSFDPSFLWDLETLGIKDKPNDPGDDIALRHFNDTVQYKENRYFVQWPYKDPKIDLPTNYQLAFGRLNSLLRRYKDNPEIFQQYHEVIQNQMDKGIIEKVETTHSTDHSNPKIPQIHNHTIAQPVKSFQAHNHKIHYIPHHAVITPDRTTKLRIVYDGSAKARHDDSSLNDCLYRGPVILDDVVALLIRFRINPIAVASDIEKAFLQVGLQEAARDVTRFLWLKDPNQLSTDGNLQIYRFTRVPFGIVSSPFLLAATIVHHLQKNPTAVTNNILQNVYVDNLITGVADVQEATEFYKQTKSIFSSASMNIRDWMSNSKEFLNSIPENDRATGKCKILGLPWDTETDQFSIVGPKKFDFDKVSKRTILQFLASFFDPLGLICPIILVGKIFLQQLWLEKLTWDAPLSNSQTERWNEIVNSFTPIQNFKFPRFLGASSSANTQFELHCFADASKDAYGIVIYLRSITGDKISPNLVFAKSRLAPIRKTMTIPRLELLAVHMGVKCLQFVAKSLPFTISQQYVWTDSQCTLHWLNSEKSLTVFVRNRVNEIKQYHNIKFQYVPTMQNPADIASRGAIASEFIQNLIKAFWNHGPDWLQKQSTTWPAQDFITRSTSIAQDKASNEDLETTMSGAAPDIATKGVGTIIDLSRFSSLLKLLRVTALCIRFKYTKTIKGPLTADEIETAQQLWIQYIQQIHLSDVFTALKNNTRHPWVTELSLWIDRTGVLRCGGRLLNAQLAQETKNPILLPKKCQFTTMVIGHFHKKLLHAGVTHTLAHIRLKYWIPAGRSQVFNFVRSCTVCRKHDGGPFRAPPMPAFPAPRVTTMAPFTATGLDYLGPLLIKEKGLPTEIKVWICLFTCLSTRAIHLEVIPDYTAEQFLLGLQRFVAYRGVPSIIISDNGTNFKAAKLTLDKIWSSAIKSESVQTYSASSGIKWQFITERAPWMGGFYERLVRTVKQCLRKSIGRIYLTMIQLQTFASEATAIINSRPLVYVGTHLDSKAVLTPSHFLGLNPKIAFPPGDHHDVLDPEFLINISTKDRILQTWLKGEKHLATFWKHWQNDYLLSLRERAQTSLQQPRIKSQFTPSIGDIVQIKNEGPRGTWQVGKIVTLFPSADGQVRSAAVQTASNKRLTRSVTHLYPLECSSTRPDNQAMTNQPAMPTSAPVGTVSHRPQRTAAQQAKARIRQLARNSIEDSEDHEISMTSSSNFKTLGRGSRPSTPPSLLCIIGLICSFFVPINGNLRPLICEAEEAKLVLDLSLKTTCPSSTTITSKDVSTGYVQLFKYNIAQYSSTAYKCKKVRTSLSTYTNFAHAGWDHKSAYDEIHVSESECQSMVKTRRCAEGPLLGSDDLAFTENKVEYYWAGGGVGCCKWQTVQTTNCFVTKGRVYLTFGGILESNLGNVAECQYDKKFCTLPDQSALIWETVKEASCKYVKWKKLFGKLWSYRFLSDDQQFALTWTEQSAPLVDLCDGQKGTMTDQGIPILFSRKSTISAPNSRKKRQVQEGLKDDSSPTDVIAAQLQALEVRLHQLFVDGLNSAFMQTCKSIQNLQQIDLILAHAEPTLIARHLLNDSLIMARLNGKLLEIWPCVAVETFSSLPMPKEQCTEWIPINSTLRGRSFTGFLDPKTNIIFQNSPPSDCKLSQEIHLHDDNGNLLLYLAHKGTIIPYTGNVVPHPLYHGNLTFINDFQEVIHKPITIYTGDELRARKSLNDLYAAYDQTRRIMLQLANSSNQNSDNSEASKIFDNMSRYTPWGMLCEWVNQLRYVWITLCCTIVTIQVLWSLILRPCLQRRVQTIIRNLRHHQNPVEPTPAHGSLRPHATLAPKAPVQVPEENYVTSHIPVEKTVTNETES